MHARIFRYGLAPDTNAAFCGLGRALAHQPGYQGRLVIATQDHRLIDWHLHDSQASAIAAWALVSAALVGPHLTAAIQLLGEGTVTTCDWCSLHAAALPNLYARIAAPHYPPADLPDEGRWGTILCAHPGYRGRLTVAAGYGRLLTLTAFDTASAYTAARDSPAGQHFIASELVPRWTAPTQHLGAGTILLADLPN